MGASVPVVAASRQIAWTPLNGARRDGIRFSIHSALSYMYLWHYTRLQWVL